MNNKCIVMLSLVIFLFFTTHPMDNKKVLNKGALIAIEGIDGAGKSTLAQAVFAALIQRGFDVILTKEPGGTELGKEIRTIVQAQTTPISAKAQYLLFAADRAQHFDELIIPALEQNKLIISDRLADSSLAYQGYGQGLDLNIIKKNNEWAMNGKKPNLTIFVNIPVETALERCNKRGALSAYEKKEFLHKVKKGFETLYYQNRNDVIEGDGTDSPEELCTLTCAAIEEWLKENNFCS